MQHRHGQYFRFLTKAGKNWKTLNSFFSTNLQNLSDLLEAQNSSTEELQYSRTSFQTKCSIPSYMRERTGNFLLVLPFSCDVSLSVTYL